MRIPEQVESLWTEFLTATAREEGTPLGLELRWVQPSLQEVAGATLADRAAFILDPDGNNIEAVCHLPD